MNLRLLLLIHAIATFAAGVVLVVAPSLIPGTVDIQLDSKANLLCYLLGASEISLASLSYFSRTLIDRQALRLVCLTFILFHLLTAGVEIYAFAQGASAKIWGNVLLRVVISSLFLYYRNRQNRANLSH